MKAGISGAWDHVLTRIVRAVLSVVFLLRDFRGLWDDTVASGGPVVSYVLDHWLGIAGLVILLTLVPWSRVLPTKAAAPPAPPKRTPVAIRLSGSGTKITRNKFYGIEQAIDLTGDDNTVDENLLVARARHPLDTEEGRTAFVNMLVMYHGQGVSQLQNGPNARWHTVDEMMNWLQQDGQWVGELIGTMRAFDCSHAEIHDIGVLGPPRHIEAYPPPAQTGESLLRSVDRYQAFVTERLHRIKDLIKKYEPSTQAAS